jgi:PilZ domain
MADKRDRERMALAGQVTGEVMVFQPMTILDISAGGAQIETPFPLQLDSLHDFRLSLGTRSVVVKGRIAHCSIGELTESSALYRTGVEFVEPSGHAKQAILAFIDHLKTRTSQPAIVEGEVADDDA